MSSDIQIRVEGFINFRGIMRDPELPQGVQVGYFNPLGTTAKPEQTRGVLTLASEVRSPLLLELLAKLLCKYSSKDGSKSRTIVIDGQTVQVEPGRVKSILEKQIDASVDH